MCAAWPFQILNSLEHTENLLATTFFFLGIFEQSVTPDLQKSLNTHLLVSTFFCPEISNLIIPYILAGEAWRRRGRQEVTSHAVEQLPGHAPPRQIVSSHKELSGGSLRCRNCGKTFSYAYNMVRHRRKCEGVFHLQCPHCGRGFHRRDKLTMHIARYHCHSHETV
ncbi:hypothetical protein BaRGS_00027458 [Batillaria attramentaria]|uniref:C2H2-type domain-containing protein n=1 Tax=Batillaria attramentaria TaxID=370345 RepID=A0ABD0K2X5_9CAEN